MRWLYYFEVIAASICLDYSILLYFVSTIWIKRKRNFFTLLWKVKLSLRISIWWTYWCSVDWRKFCIKMHHLCIFSNIKQNQQNTKDLNVLACNHHACKFKSNACFSYACIWKMLNVEWNRKTLSSLTFFSSNKFN